MTERIDYFQNYFTRLLAVTDENELDVLEYVDCMDRNNLKDAHDINNIMREEFPEIKIIGGESVGVVVHSTAYPDVVAKYICNEITASHFGLDFNPVNFDVIGYCNFLNTDLIPRELQQRANKLSDLPPPLLDILVPTFETNDCGNIVINKYYPKLRQVVTIEPTEDKPLVLCNVPLTEQFLKYYIDLIRHGYFIVDLHTDNFTYDSSTNKLMIVDLDGLVYSPELPKQLTGFTGEELITFIKSSVGMLMNDSVSDVFLNFILDYLKSEYNPKHRLTSDIWS